MEVRFDKGKLVLPAINISDVRLLNEFNNHEMIIELTSASDKLRGFIGIHNTNLGPALGGTRIKTYSSNEEALKDVLNLSKAMSYKCALAGLPFGGGKGVILIPQGDYDRDELLAAYARMVEKLGGLFKTGTDVGLLDKDVKHMAKFTSHMLGVKEADRGNLTTANVAALGVFYGIKAAFEHIYGSNDMQGKKIAIKGLGKLGAELLRLTHEEGAKIVTADINVEVTQAITQRYPDVTIVSPDEIHTQQVDLYAPCALGAEFDEKTIAELKTNIIVGGANNQLVDESIGDRLFEKNILYAPDYIANAGGLIYVADELEKDGFNKDRVMARTQKIHDTLSEIFRRSKAEQKATHRIANAIAQERMKTNG